MKFKTCQDYIDAHIHLNSKNNYEISKKFIYFLNSTEEKDWEILKSIYSNNNNIIPFFGIHPWYVTKVTENWFEKLEKIIESNDKYFLGEIGIDRIKAKKSKTDNNLDLQIDIFKIQLELAVKYNRPVSVHCVKAWDILLEILKDLNQQITGILHYFNGSIQIMNKLIEYGFYISFFPDIFEENRFKTLQAFKLCPNNRLFLETDIEIGNNTGILKEHYIRAAETKNIKTEELIRILKHNGEIFTDKTFNW